ncbi:hypothetical protein VP01_708g2 [Puccinia sorghi]|uniref:Uncharacterized protein n=1 Tax=Puccinia sorghi TaxID=27349 RepID=A0A0L6UDM1_9BASI|nr:hypothetical protein VP01_708g2 [Puccinia sorghi]
MYKLAEIQTAPVDLGGHHTLLRKLITSFFFLQNKMYQATDNVFGRPRTGQQSMGISTRPLLDEDSSRPSRGGAGQIIEHYLGTDAYGQRPIYIDLGQGPNGSSFGGVITFSDNSIYPASQLNRHLADRVAHFQDRLSPQLTRNLRLRLTPNNTLLLLSPQVLSNPEPHHHSSSILSGALLPRFSSSLASSYLQGASSPLLSGSCVDKYQLVVPSSPAMTGVDFLNLSKTDLISNLIQHCSTNIFPLPPALLPVHLIFKLHAALSVGCHHHKLIWRAKRALHMAIASHPHYYALLPKLLKWLSKTQTLTRRATTLHHALRLKPCHLPAWGHDLPYDTAIPAPSRSAGHVASITAGMLSKNANGRFGSPLLIKISHKSPLPQRKAEHQSYPVKPTTALSNTHMFAGYAIDQHDRPHWSLSQRTQGNEALALMLRHYDSLQFSAHSRLVLAISSSATSSFSSTLTPPDLLTPGPINKHLMAGGMRLLN